MRRLLISIALGAILAAASPAAAQEVIRIAAVVNDDVISVYDLNARMRLILVSTSLPDTPENRRRLTGQVLRGLIDEKLQLQEAKRLNVTVDSSEIERALGEVEARNNIPAGQLQDFLKRAGVALSTLVHQVRAAIAWNRVLRRNARDVTQIGDEEIDEALAEMKANRGQPQSQVSEIFLAVDRPEQEQEVGTIARRLVEQIRGGASFGALARQLSQSATAAVDGDIGSVRPGQLAPELDAVLEKMKPGQVSDPIRTPTGYQILWLRDRRVLDQPAPEELSITLEHLFIPLPPTPNQADRDSTVDLARTIADTVHSCDDLRSVRKESNAPKFPLPNRMKLGDLAPSLREKIAPLEIGQASEPMLIGNGVLILMVCERETPPGLPSRDQIRQTLTSKRIDILARRYMRDLRRAAFVDLRV